MTGKQATVLTFDAETREGSVVTDAGTVVSFGSAAFDAGGLRLLRLGQRVRLVLSEGGAVKSLTVITMAMPSDAEGDPAEVAGPPST
jgi:hypothetical protein